MFELEICYQEKDKIGKGKIATEKFKDKSKNDDEDGDDNVVERIDNQVVFPGGKIGLLRKTLESIAEIVDHVEIKAREQGLEMQVMDSLHVVFADIFLSKNLFDKYRCDRDITLGIKIKTLITILKDLTFPQDSLLHISCDDNPSKLDICYKQPQYTLNWELSLYSFDNELFEMPKFEFNAEILMSTSQYMVLPKMVGIYGEFITIDASKNRVVFKQCGDTTSAAMTLEEDASKGVEINVSQEIKKEMAMKYITIIGKSAILCSKVKLHMGHDTPIFFDFSIYDLGYMRYYIASKVEGDN